ncbi:MAG TPA: helix-turn-helix domain-containing protein [Rhodocyclaceae bacterium]|nr:helix-turn-helix domain-containing protein [Rhodocyclaceae bacterium]
MGIAVQTGAMAPQESGRAGRLGDVSNAVIRVQAQRHAEAFDHYAVSRIRLATLTIHSIESDPVSISRRDEDILEDRIFDVLLHVQVQGSAEITQGGRTFNLSPGAIAIVPGGIPYHVCYPEKGRKIILRIPHRVFHERVLGREVRDFGATVFSGDGLVPVVIDLLKSMTLEKEGALSEVEQFTLAESFLALVGTVVRSRRTPGPKDVERNRSARLCRILSYLEEHFSDHELTPARVAEANMVSLRHLHGLFKESGTTVSRWIWDRRLRAGREDLLDPKLATLTICDIAFRRGFSDSAHFSRAFKERFGISPCHLRAKGRSGSHGELAGKQEAPAPARAA